jgi:hypothetical protein
MTRRKVEKGNVKRNFIQLVKKLKLNVFFYLIVLELEIFFLAKKKNLSFLFLIDKILLFS